MTRLLVMLLILWPQVNFAAEQDTGHKVIRRIVMFPIHITAQHKKIAENAWWANRKFLADSKRFFVATKRFLVQRDVLHPRKEISLSDAILLSKLLNADVLISTYVDDNKVYMVAYSGQDGFPLWESQLNLNPSLPLKDQLGPMSMRLTQNFFASIPYHGFQIVDPLIGSPVYEEGNITLAKVDVGASSSIEPGDKIQWIQINRKNKKPLFQTEGNITVIAEGEVIKSNLQTLDVEIKRVHDKSLLKKKTLVYSPQEHKKLSEKYALHNDNAPKLTTTFLSSPLYPTTTKASEISPLITAITAIANVIAVVFLIL